ncbi:protein Wiz isoform X9 [Engystomops pustulosus]|uniref:protein Wiz isoform X9 n=1 Tax=Engystomops pustulosus TaxID=76066 RepID=UPI003AFA15DD
MEDIPSTYLSAQEDVDNLVYPLPTIGQNEACAPMPGGVEIVLVGGGEANIGAYPEEGGVLTSFPHMGYREDSEEGIRMTHPRDSDGINCGITGRSDQEHHSSKYTLPPPDHRTVHHLGSRQPSTHTTTWGYSDAVEEGEGESDGMTSEEKYRRFEWSSGLDEVEGHSQLMMIRSDPPSINMPAFRRALQLGRAHEAWQGNYSEEDAHVEVEEEEEEEEGSVYTCIECNIYFKKKAHLLEHMFQHSQEGEAEGLQAGEVSHTCGECGKGFGDEESLDSHRQLHQESRQKIIEEISKLENLADEGRDARLQCPKCLFGTNSSKVFVQHAKTHVRKVSGETRGNPTSFRTTSEMLEGGESSEMTTEVIWKSPEAEATAEKGWRSGLQQSVMQGPSKIKRKMLAREDLENSMHTDGEMTKSTKTIQLPDAAVKLKRRFREALRSSGGCEGDQRQQLKDQVAVVILQNINAKKKKPKGPPQPLGFGKKQPTGNKGLQSRYERHLSKDDWGEAEEDVPLDALLMDPKYASQLEALGLRSEERECPYCPDRFHNGIGLANHVRGHLNRVGVSYNVRHFISAEEVKAIEQNYSFQKKRKKALSDEDDGTPLDLGRPQISKSDQGRAEKMASDQSGDKTEESKAVEGETGRENECQFCGAWFETRKGLSSHARAHLRHLGVTDPDTKGSAIAALNSLVKSEEFKKRLSGSMPADDASVDGPSKEPTTDQSPSKNNEATKEGVEKGNNETSTDVSDHQSETSMKLSESTGPIETSAHFKCPSGSGNTTHIKIVEAGAPQIMPSAGNPHTKIMEAGAVHRNPVRLHGKLESPNKHKPLIMGLGHPRPSPSHTPPTKKMRMSPSPNMESYWSPKNVSTPLNLSPSSEEVRCEFCGEFFENRKGLSSHARSHLRQMGVTEWHVNGSPIDTLREILATGNCPRSANRIGGPNPDKLLSHHPPSSPSGSHPFSGLSPTMQRKHPQLPTFTASEWPADLSPLNLSSRADPTRDIRCEFCNEFFENRKGLSSHARSHLRQMGVTEWHVNGSPIDTLREIIRKRRPMPPQQQLTTIKKEPRGNDEPPSPSQRLSPLGMGSQGMARDLSVSPHGRPHNNFLSPMPAKRPVSHGPRQPDHRGFVNIEPKTCNQTKSYIQGEPRPKTFIQEDGRPKTFIQSDGRPKTFLGADGRPKTFIHDGRPKGFLTGDPRPKAFIHGEHKPKAFLHGEGRPKPYLPVDGKPKHFMHGDNKPKVYSPDGKPKAYIQTELPFKVKVKASPEKTVTSLEACCELCGLFFENRKALASHARAHLRQFGVTEWCVNGSPIETLREWMKQRPQKAGAYLSYIQGGRPYTKKFKRALQSPKPGITERESPAVTPAKVPEPERSVVAHGVTAEKPSEVHGHKIERRHPKPAEVPPTRDETVADQPPKAEEPRPPVRARPVPSLVPRPPQTSLVKFVGNIYTLKCRFCDIQFQGPLSIQEQWVRHLQHHILEMNFSKSPSPPHTHSSQEPQPEPAKAQ